MHAAGPASKARRQTRARASPRAISPARATCLIRDAVQRGRHVQVARGNPPAVHRCRRRPGEAVRRHLRLGRNRQLPDLRRAPAREPRHAALRRKLERMGRRSGDAQGERTRLAADQVGKARKPLADCLRDQVDGSRVRLTAGAARANDGFETCSSLADHAFRTGIEAASHAPSQANSIAVELFGIAGRAAAARLEQRSACWRPAMRAASSPPATGASAAASIERICNMARSFGAAMVKKIVKRLTPPASRRCRAGSSRAAGWSR